MRRDRAARAVALLAIGVLALQAVAAQGQTVCEEVVRLLQTQDRARVVVALVRPPGDIGFGSQRESAIAARRQRVLAAVPTGEFAVARSYRMVSAVAGEVTQEGLAALLESPDVARVDLDVGGQGALGESLRMVGAHDLAEQGVDGHGVVVAIVDSGIDGGHPDLEGALIGEFCACENEDGSGCCPDGSREQSGEGSAVDDWGHGTAVAGVVRSSGQVAPRGVAPAVELVGVKVLDQDGIFAWSSQVVAGLDWLLAERDDVDVVNMSLGTFARYDGHCDEEEAWILAFAEAIEGLRARGTLSFACTGNEAEAHEMEVPACVESTVAVGAVYDEDFDTFASGVCVDTDAAAGAVCCFSNSSPALDLVAPGAWITTSDPGSSTRTGWGTSYASPHAAGAAALLIQLDPELMPDDIEAMLKTGGVLAFDDRTGLEHPSLSVSGAIRLLPEDCANREDDNYDDQIDCADPQCEGGEGPIGQVCEPGGETICDDLADNDENGAVDCQDAACAGEPYCPTVEDGGDGCACTRSSSDASDGFHVALVLLALAHWRRRP